MGIDGCECKTAKSHADCENKRSFYCRAKCGSLSFWTNHIVHRVPLLQNKQSLPPRQAMCHYYEPYGGVTVALRSVRIAINGININLLQELPDEGIMLNLAAEQQKRLAGP